MRQGLPDQRYSYISNVEMVLLAECAYTHKGFVFGLQVLPVLTMSATHNGVKHIIEK